MKTTKIITFIICSLTLKALACSDIYSKNSDGELIISNQTYPNILKNDSNLNTSLTQFMGVNALEYSNTNGRNAYFTFSNESPELIDCIYNNSREVNNGFLNRNAICGLNIGINTAIDNYSNIINNISNKEVNFKLNRNIDNEITDKLDIKLNIYKNSDTSITINYNTLNDYIDASPYITISNSGTTILKSSNYFVEYMKIKEDYKIKNITYYNEDGKYVRHSINNTIFSCSLSNNKNLTVIRVHNKNHYIYKNNEHVELKYPHSNESPLSFDNENNIIYFNKGDYAYSITKGKANQYTLSVKNNDKIIFNKSCKNILTPFPSNINEYFN